MIIVPLKTHLAGEVDGYYEDVFLPEDAALEKTLQSMRDADMPMINVSALQGRFLKMLIEMSGAKRVLEIGTLAGYSAIWVARGLPDDSELVTLEIEKEYADIAAENIAGAKLDKKIKIVVGDAEHTMPQLSGPFDFIFIDADKLRNPLYLELSLKLSKPGTWIFADNVVRNGGILENPSKNEGVIGMRKFNEMVAADGRLEATAIQTIGAKGYDGFVLLKVKTL